VVWSHCADCITCQNKLHLAVGVTKEIDGLGHIEPEGHGQSGRRSRVAHRTLFIDGCGNSETDSYPVGIDVVNWITQSYWQLLEPVWAGIVLTLASIVAGAVIGSERERQEKPAGMRTLILVSLGAAIFTMSSFAFVTTTGDSGRVAAQIVTGIGFLGAGVILHSRRTVVGVTTAATIWVTAAIGLTAGAGYAIPGLALSGIVRAVLDLVRRYEKKYLDHVCLWQPRIVFRSQQGKTKAKLQRILSAYHIQPSRGQWAVLDADRGQLDLAVQLAERKIHEVAGEIADLEEVESLEERTATSPDA
jgi:putative Mg2+ transporter-C (MgtC) family protein